MKIEESIESGPQLILVEIERKKGKNDANESGRRNRSRGLVSEKECQKRMKKIVFIQNENGHVARNNRVIKTMYTSEKKKREKNGL